MQAIKVLRHGKWHDKPYQPQFEVDEGEEILVGEGTIVVDGKASLISSSMATIMCNAKAAQFVEVAKATPAEEDKKAAEVNPAKADKKAAGKG